jgi:oligopeptide/dipeptide ABC transporter ATP-binding protein
MTEPLLEIRDLVTSFHTDEGIVRAVDGVSFEVPRGKVVGVVGESGCGKSVTALSVMRLIPTPPGRVESGSIRFDGQDLLALPERELRRIRGNRISMIFQEPMTSLNPVYTVGQQIMEAVQLHQRVGKKAARAKAIEMLQLVGIPAPAERVDAYPHELSGGMRQRVMIAMALSCEPELLVADEPTTALDVTIQAQILELLARLQKELEMSIVLITHDLGVVAEFADEVVVMYTGKVVERARTAELFPGTASAPDAHEPSAPGPKHPYTRGLLASVPGVGDNTRMRRLPTIPGMVPDLRELPVGCNFQDRCPDVVERCRNEEPPLEPVAAGSERTVACWVATGRANPSGRADAVPAPEAP